MQPLLDELEKQIQESKTKLEESTNIISSLEKEVDDYNKTIVHIV